MRGVPRTVTARIPSLIEAIRPAVKIAQDQLGDLLDNAIKQNVLFNMAKLQTTSPILSDAVRGGKLKVAGGLYSLDTGRVTLIA
jgi:carbonic anhydrase